MGLVGDHRVCEGCYGALPWVTQRISGNKLGRMSYEGRCSMVRHVRHGEIFCHRVSPCWLLRNGDRSRHKAVAARTRANRFSLAVDRCDSSSSECSRHRRHYWHISWLCVRVSELFLSLACSLSISQLKRKFRGDIIMPHLSSATAVLGCI